jgi:hypothetical protein
VRDDSDSAGTVPKNLSRRIFLEKAAIASGALTLRALGADTATEASLVGKQPPIAVEDLPRGTFPAALSFPHFPDRLHAFVWRNWSLVPLERMAQVIGAKPADLARVGEAMGLPAQPPISVQQQRRSYITVIRRNWHLLPYGQLLELLGWSAAQMAFTLREDDFLFVKLGNLKPRCEPLRYSEPSPEVMERETQIARIVQETFPGGLRPPKEPLFTFVGELSQPPATAQRSQLPHHFSPGFCYSYFALYGDPLLDQETDPYPEGYLARLAGVGVDGIWLQGVLHKLAPFKWDITISSQREIRLQRLAELVKKGARHGISVYLYLNEPRAMPLSFYDSRPELKGVAQGEHAALCTSQPQVQSWIADSVEFICRKVPGLGGFFTISASENLSNCWSHGGGAACPRCSKRAPAEVISEVNGLFYQGIQRSGSNARLMVWDWGWADEWAPGIIDRLPTNAALMSVSEWSMPIRRGGIQTRVGEYSISAIGPGPRAQKHWALARRRGLKTLAKIQAGNTWELSAVPYIPALENVAQHIANLSELGLDGLMLGWTLGGYPSPNLEIVSEVAHLAQSQPPTNRSELVAMAMERVANRRFGQALGPAVVTAWRSLSAAFREFPFDAGLVYNAPLQSGPSNLLWMQPTGYRATMVGFPYDDLDGWRGPYPAEVFIGQFRRMAAGFEQACQTLAESSETLQKGLDKKQADALQCELDITAACAIHFRSTANQALFVVLRRALQNQANAKHSSVEQLNELLKDEMVLASRLYDIQCRDSRIGFEASNQYYYVPLDLVEKILNCRALLALNQSG